MAVLASDCYAVFVWHNVGNAAHSFTGQICAGCCLGFAVDDDDLAQDSRSQAKRRGLGNMVHGVLYLYCCWVYVPVPIACVLFVGREKQLPFLCGMCGVRYIPGTGGCGGLFQTV